MKAPKCPKCGKTHYSTQRCGADESAGRGKRSDQPSQPVGNDTAKASGVVPDSARWETPRSPLKSVRPADTEVHRESSSGDQDAPVSGEGRYEEFSVPVVKSAPASTTPQQEIERATSESGPLTPSELEDLHKDAIETSAEMKRLIALTPAEKQKAYRKRLKDDPKAHEAYLEANKLRMRKNRDE